MMTPQLRWRILVAFATLLSLATLHCHGKSSAEWSVVRERLDARPVMVRVDLSRPGSVTVPLRQSPGAHQHGQFLYLDPGSATMSPSSDPLKGLSGAISITDGRGNEVERIPLREGMEIGSAGANRYPLGTRLTLPEGEYKLTVAVETGAEGLAGGESIIYSQYAVCELETLPAMFWGLLSWTAGVAAAVAWLIVAVRLARKRREGTVHAAPK